MPLLIQGIFFQDWGSGSEPFCFTGVIRDETGGSASLLSGELRDRFGHAVLSDIGFTGKGLTFKKQYLRAPYNKELVEYAYELQPDDTWLGNWTRRGGNGECDSGFTRCIVTEVSEAFFHSPSEIRLVEVV